MAASESGKVMMFGVLLLLGLGIFYLGSLAGKQNVIVNPGTGQQNTITVNGEAEKKVSPDQLVLRFSVETKDLDAAVSESKNAEIVDKVRLSLFGLGIPESEISTDYYSIYPEYETVIVEQEGRDGDAMVPPSYYYPYPVTKQGNLTGYKTTHSITIKTGKIDSAGKLVSAIAGASGDSGTVSISEVSFGLKDSTRKDVEVELLSLASADAKKKAEKLVSGVGASLGKTVSISSGYVTFPYYKNYADSYLAMEGGSAPRPAEVFPEELAVTSSVSAAFEIKE